MSVFYVKTAKSRRLKLRPTLYKCFKFKAFILKTHTKTQKLGKFSAFALLSVLKKSYQNIESNGLKSNVSTKNDTFKKKYRWYR